MKFSRSFFASSLLVSLLFTTTPLVFAETATDDLLTSENISSTPPVYARPASKIAENVTVITSREIAAINAHSLADVLQTVAGIHVMSNRTPGSFTFFKIQGEDDGYGNILLIIDGVNQGNLLQGTNDPGLIAVQNIERIEIIKGSASAAWGAALGGVINIVTKSHKVDKAVTGSASATYGERGTSDRNADLSGYSNGLGFYLSGGNLYSRGLLPNNGINRSNLYGKLSYDLPSKGNITVGGSYIEAKRGITSVYDVDYLYTFTNDSIDNRHYLFTEFTYPIQSDLTLILSGLSSNIRSQAVYADDVTITPGTVSPYAHYILKENNSGLNARLNWGDNQRNIKSGVEYLHSSITQIDQLNNPSEWDVNRTRDSLALYANGAVTVDRLTLLPGIRYVRTGLSGNTTNLTLGATYNLTGKTLLRSYVANGYAMPDAFQNSTLKRIWTAQAGLESEELPYIWFKGNLFYNHIWNDQNGPNKYNRQGFEAELKTVPLFGLSLSGGYTYTDARDADSKEVIKGVPRHIAKIKATYNNSDSGFMAVASGNYAFLNIDSGTPHYPHYSPMIWDLHLTQQLMPGKELSPELFFSARNLFNGSQYWDYYYVNAKRWVEGGVRFKF